MADMSRVTSDPAVLDGQPTIRNMRISVRAVLDMVDAGGAWAVFDA